MHTLIPALVSILTLGFVVGCTDKDDSTDTSAASGGESGEDNTDEGPDVDTDDTDDTGDDTSPPEEDGDAHLIGIGFNNEAGTYELRTVDPDTAEVTALASINFGSAGFSTWPGVVTDSAAGVAYAFTEAGSLYSIAMDGSMYEWVGDLTGSLQHLDVGAGGLVGIGYNSVSDVNVLRTVDTATAEVTDLTTFSFDTGYWQSYVVNDPEAGVVYALSTSDTLYRLQMDGSGVEEVGTLSQSIQHMGLGIDGLIGIGYNNSTGLNEVRSVNTETAEVTTLTSFSFDTGYWEPWVTTDPRAGVFYAFSTANTMYRLQMDGSGVETIGELSDNMLAIALGAY